MPFLLFGSCLIFPSGFELSLILQLRLALNLVDHPASAFQVLRFQAFCTMLGLSLEGSCQVSAQHFVVSNIWFLSWSLVSLLLSLSPVMKEAGLTSEVTSLETVDSAQVHGVRESILTDGEWRSEVKVLSSELETSFSGCDSHHSVYQVISVSVSQACRIRVAFPFQIACELLLALGS